MRLLGLVLIMAACGSSTEVFMEYIPQYCRVTDTGFGALITCPDGSSVEVSNGINGLDGKDGEDAPSIEMRRFCDVTESYPSVLAEYGFCIGGNLYAVAQIPGNRTFLTRLLPGSYRTTDGAACNFRVVSGCTTEALP